MPALTAAELSGDAFRLFPQRRPVMRLDLPVEVSPSVARPHALRVGLLGGSFNPAHEGHRYISVEALKRLGLDQVWWLVSPQNPLKPVAGMAPFAERMAGARAMATHPRLRVMDLENRYGTRYTADTLRRLTARKDCRFVWMIGADNMVQMPHWKRWTEIVGTCAIAVFARAPYSYRSMRGEMAVRFDGSRIDGERAEGMADLTPPAWTFVRLRPHPASSTRIRTGEGARHKTEGTP